MDRGRMSVMGDDVTDLHLHEQVVREALARLNEARDVEGYVACCTDDVVFTSTLGIARGKAEFRAFHDSFELLSKRSARIERLLVSGDSVAVWQTSAGTVAATGRSFEVEVCGIFDVRDGKICAVTEYVDAGPIVAAFTTPA
jgi:ketosteroid isomerase-like protein